MRLMRLAERPHDLKLTVPVRAPKPLNWSRTITKRPYIDDLPAKVLSELLGLSVNAATRWNAFSGIYNAEYAADVVHRQGERDGLEPVKPVIRSGPTKDCQ